MKPAPTDLRGLQKIVRAYGGMNVNGQAYVWDYVAERAVPESEMPFGGDRWKASERAKWCVDAVSNLPEGRG